MRIALLEHEIILGIVSGKNTLAWYHWKWHRLRHWTAEKEARVGPLARQELDTTEWLIIIIFLKITATHEGQETTRVAFLRTAAYMPFCPHVTVVCCAVTYTGYFNSRLCIWTEKRSLPVYWFNPRSKTSKNTIWINAIRGHHNAQ